MKKIVTVFALVALLTLTASVAYADPERPIITPTVVGEPEADQQD